MRQHVKRLEDEAELVAPQARQRILVEPRVVAPVERQPPAVGPVEAGDEVEQRRLADARLADDGDVLAGLRGAAKYRAARRDR